MVDDMAKLIPRPRPHTALGRWLEDNRITMEQLADAARVNKSTISRIARGQQGAGEDVEKRLLRITGLKRL